MLNKDYYKSAENGNDGHHLENYCRINSLRCHQIGKIWHPHGLGVYPVC